METDDTRDATIAEIIEEGKSNGRQSAGFLLQHCFGKPPVEQMTPEVWWKVHEEIIEPDILGKLKSSGATTEELDAFLGAWRSELDWCCLTYASLGVMGVDPEIYGIDSKTNVHKAELEELDNSSTLEECISAGKRCGVADARVASLRGHYRGYDYATVEMHKVIAKRVRNLFIAGLDETHRQYFIDAAGIAGTEYFAEVSRRWKAEV
jgi:hypothetical protein